jgi:hypothetical protein
VVWALRPRAAASGPGSESADSQDGEGEPDPDALPDEPGLAPYVLKVRESAYGWPGGVRPGAGSS